MSRKATTIVSAVATTFVSMETIGQRIKRLREDKGWTQRDLGARANCSAGAIGNVEAGTRERPRNLLDIANALGVDPYYLETGNTSQHSSFAPPGSGVAVYSNEDELGDSYVWIDRFDLALSAGTGELQWVVHEKDPIAFRSRFFEAKRLSSRDCRALYVRGKSMEPYLMDGDTVLIDTSKTQPEDGEIFAVYFDDQYWIKAINIIPNGIRLVSLNPAFTPIDVTGDQLESVKIIGKKMWRGG